MSDTKCCSWTQRLVDVGLPHGTLIYVRAVVVGPVTPLTEDPMEQEIVCDVVDKSLKHFDRPRSIVVHPREVITADEARRLVRG